MASARRGWQTLFQGTDRMTLSPAQLETLRNLSRKKAGGAVGWVAIAEARALTDLGLAERNRSGWQITDEGEALLERAGPANRAEGSSDPLPFQPRGEQD
jgi:hypothetical protein